MGGSEIVGSGALAESWTPSFDLKRGDEYAWQVERTVRGVRSIHPAAPAAPTRFRVLAAGAADEINEARTRYPDDFLLHAVILAHHGLRKEALEAVDRLQRGDATLASDLRKSLRIWPR